MGLRLAKRAQTSLNSVLRASGQVQDTLCSGPEAHGTFQEPPRPHYGPPIARFAVFCAVVGRFQTPGRAARRREPKAGQISGETTQIAIRGAPFPQLTPPPLALRWCPPLGLAQMRACNPTLGRTMGWGVRGVRAETRGPELGYGDPLEPFQGAAHWQWGAAPNQCSLGIPDPAA